MQGAYRPILLRDLCTAGSLHVHTQRDRETDRQIQVDRHRQRKRALYFTVSKVVAYLKAIVIELSKRCKLLSYIIFICRRRRRREQQLRR